VEKNQTVKSDWCLTPALEVFQPYRGLNKFFKLIVYLIKRHKYPDTALNQQVVAFALNESIHLF
jgi:hypothetical protein